MGLDTIRPTTALDPKAQEQQPMVNLQVYQPTLPKQKPIDPSTFLPATVPNVYYPPQMTMPPYMWSWGQQPNPINIIKNYRIDTTGPTANHSKVSHIFEDVLPTKNISATATTISERVTMINYVRAMLFSKGDGSQVSLDGTCPDSLISRVKIMDLNPYNTYKFSSNPYKGLPEDFLIYRSCYPITHEPITNTVSCARGSMGANIRIYKLTNESYQINSQQNNNPMSYETWRDIAYYEYIREQVIKKNESPNFVALYGYYLNENSNIDFDKVSLIKGEEKQYEQKYIYERQNPINNNNVISNINYMGLQPRIDNPKNPSVIISKINRTDNPNIHIQNLYGGKKNYQNQKGGCDASGNNLSTSGNMDLSNINIKNTSQCMLQTVGLQAPLLQQTLPNLNQTLPNLNQTCHLGSCIDKSQPTVFYSNPKAYSGTVLVAITESPLYNLYGWASKTYQAEGNIRKMINTGYHLDNVWKSVLFQMMVGLYALQIHGIVFDNYNVENNIYVKDLNPHGNVTNFWKYKIDGIDYYIPNYSFLVLFDSSYQDIPKSSTSIISVTKQQHKISGKPFGDSITNDDIKMKTFDQFKKTFSTNIFNQSFVDIGGCKPSPDILRYLENIMDYTSRDKNYEIGEYFMKFMRQFMNNRIGTYLREIEISNIRKNDAKDFMKGNIIIYEEAANTFKFVLYYKEASPGVIRILSKDVKSNDIIEMDVAISLLYNYSKVEPITQNFKINEFNLNEDDLLETYIMNKN